MIFVLEYQIARATFINNVFNFISLENKKLYKKMCPTLKLDFKSPKGFDRKSSKNEIGLYLCGFVFKVPVVYYIHYKIYQLYLFHYDIPELRLHYLIVH